MKQRSSLKIDHTPPDFARVIVLFYLEFKGRNCVKTITLKQIDGFKRVFVHRY